MKNYSSTTKRISYNVLYQIAGKIIGAGTSFLITLYLALLYGPSGYGDIVKVIMYVSAFFIIADFGFNAVYLSDSQKQIALPSLFVLRVFWAAFLFGCAYLFLYFIPVGLNDGYTTAVRVGILLYAPAIFFQAIITTANAVFQKYLRYDYSFYAISGGSLVALVVLYVLSTTRLSAPFVGAIIFLCASAVTMSVSYFFMKRLVKTSLHYDRGYIYKLFFSSFPIGLTLVANLIYAHADSFVLTLTRQTAEVGTYGFAYKFFEVLLVIPTFMMNASYPILLVSKKHSRTSFFKQYKKLAVFMTVCATVLSVGVWVLAPILVYFRSDFVSSVEYIRILVLSLPFFFLSSLVMWMLFAFNKRWELAIIYVVAMILNIAANIFFVPRFGAVASSWITVVSEGLVLLTTYTLLCQSLRKVGYNSTT